MASPETLFGVPYDRHTVVGLKSFLDAVSKPYKPSSTKRSLFSALVDFEKSLSVNQIFQGLVIHTQVYYNTKNTSDAERAENNLFGTLRRASQFQNRNNQHEANEDKAETNKTSPGKRKHSEISNGIRKPKKNKPKASKSRECSVCFDDLPNKCFPKADITVTCEHDNRVCTVCIDAHVDASIDIGQFGFITCPMCPEVLVLEDVRRLWK